jgi:Mg2+/Co2+ transporter CorB
LSDLPTGILLSLLLFLLMCSAFFSSSETALMMLNRYRLRHLSQHGHRGAQLAERLLHEPDRLIGLILLGNNFVNILASVLATIIALRLGGEPALAVATGLLTLVVLIYAEVIPKTLAASRPELIAFPAAYVYTLLLKILHPLVWLINRITHLHLWLLGLSGGKGDSTALSREELRTVVSEAGAMIPKRHRSMLIGILDLEKATAEDIMVPRNEVVGIDLQDPLDDIEDFLENTHFARILIYDGSLDNIIGTIHARDCLRLALQKRLSKESLRKHSHVPYFIPEGTPLSTLMINFQRDRHRVGLIVDEYGDLQGLVTFANLVEQIIGEFTTDPTASLQDAYLQEDGSYMVSGNANVRELVKSTGWRLPLNGPKTVNGLILEHLETIPEPNTSLLLAGYPVEIMQVDDNMVRVARFQPALYKKH